MCQPVLLTPHKYAWKNERKKHRIEKQILNSCRCSVKRIAIAALLVFVLYGCGTKSASTPATPKSLFDIPVEKVTEPQLYQYGPALGQVVQAIKTEKDGESTSVVMHLDYSIMESGSQLAWHVLIPELEENGKPLNLRVPLMDLSFNTTKQGEMHNLAFTFPIIKEYNITDPKVLAKFDKAAESMEQLTISLPDYPITSGQILYRVDLDEFAPIFKSIVGDPVHRLDGEFSYDGVRYVIISLNETVTAKLKETGESITMLIEGKAVHRKDNMEEISSFHQIIATDSRGKNIFKRATSTLKVDAPLSH